MLWIAPSEKDTDTAALEKHLWKAADPFRANSGLKSQEYLVPVFRLIFLRFAEVHFAAAAETMGLQLYTTIHCFRWKHDLLLQRLRSGQVAIKTN